MLAVTYTAKSLSFLAAHANRGLRGAGRAVKALAVAIAHRREVMSLSELDDRGLKDIGLVRSDVEGALASSWLRDPSSVLAARSNQQQRSAAARREAGLRRASVNAASQNTAPQNTAKEPARLVVQVPAIPVACSA